jgi:hypothetical protein
VSRQARFRANRKNLPCSITKEYLIEKWTGLCPATGKVLEPGGRVTPTSPSVDRIVPALGYVPGNIAIISVAANRIKSEATAPEIRAVADWLEQSIGKDFMNNDKA